MEISIPDEFKLTYPPGLKEFPLYLRSGKVTTLVGNNPKGGGNYVDLIVHGLNNFTLREIRPVSPSAEEESAAGEYWMNFGFPPPGPPPPWYGDPNNPGSGFDYIRY